MLMTMDMPPFAQLYDAGPKSTWMQRLPDGVRVLHYSGQPIPEWRRPLSAVRERFRFLGAKPVNMSIAGRSTWLTRLTDFLMVRGFPPSTRSRRAVSLALRLVSRVIRIAEWSAAKLRRRKYPLVSQQPDRVQVDRVQTLANMLDMQLAAFAWAVDAHDPDGFLIITLSTYLDAERALLWHRSTRAKGVDFASMEAVYPKGRLFQGGCMYFSREGMRSLLEHDRELARGVLNDVAITEWLVRSGRNWVDMPVVSLTGTDGLPDPCPLCVDTELLAIRCTCHEDRKLEVARMMLLDAHARGEH